ASALDNQVHPEEGYVASRHEGVVYVDLARGVDGERLLEPELVPGLIRKPVSVMHTAVARPDPRTTCFHELGIRRVVREVGTAVCRRPSDLHPEDSVAIVIPIVRIGGAEVVHLAGIGL